MAIHLLVLAVYAFAPSGSDDHHRISERHTAASSTTEGACNTTSTKNVDRCPGGPPGYKEQQVTSGAGAASECAALCCADPACEVWVTRPIQGGVGVGNCSAGSTCCWTKPACSGTLASPGTTSGTIFRKNNNFSFIDTALWVGTEYTPARAANSLWWARFPEFEADIKADIALSSCRLSLDILT